MATKNKTIAEAVDAAPGVYETPPTDAPETERLAIEAQIEARQIDATEAETSEPAPIEFGEKALRRFLGEFSSDPKERKAMQEALEGGADPDAMTEKFYPDTENTHFERYFKGRVRDVIASKKD